MLVIDCLSPVVSAEPAVATRERPARAAFQE
jgi:hypothetical protein